MKKQTGIVHSGIHSACRRMSRLWWFPFVESVSFPAVSVEEIELDSIGTNLSLNSVVRVVSDGRKSVSI